jgi:hypothetical protein
MPIQESSATALVRFTGLGILCFNEDRARGEIGIVRDTKHTLTLKIQKPTYKEGSEADVIIYEDVAVYENLPKENVEIEITAEQPVIEGYQIYQSGDFSRLEATDPNDFRWIVNFDELHENAPLVKAGEADRYPLTNLYINNGLFYTHRLDEKLFFEKVTKGADGAREPFGNIAETIGAKIEGETVNVTIRFDGKEEKHSLKRVAGLPFRIEFKNMDYNAKAVYSDLPDYYRYRTTSTGVQVELAPVIEGGGEQRVKGGAVNQDDFCHPLFMDVPSLDEL